jgi:FixJ family two-component response regulator
VSAPAVFVVDDDPSLRKSLTRVLTTAGYAVETFASARDFMARPPFPSPSCVVLDVRMPGLSGLDLQEVLVSGARPLPIVFITGHGDIPMSVKAMRAGAVDFLTKPFDVSSLLGAIERAVARAAQHRGEEDQTADVLARVKRLTPRETEVLALVVTGMLNKQVAAELRIGLKTVKVHRARVMEKMRAGSVAELVRLADRAGVVIATSLVPAARSPGARPGARNTDTSAHGRPRSNSIPSGLRLQSEQTTAP